MRVQRINNNYNVSSFNGKLTILSSTKIPPYNRVFELKTPQADDKRLYGMFIKIVGDVGDGPGIGSRAKNEIYYQYLRLLNIIIKNAAVKGIDGGKYNKEYLNRLNYYSNINFEKIAKSDQYPNPKVFGLSWYKNSYQLSISTDKGYTVEHVYNE